MEISIIFSFFSKWTLPYNYRWINTNLLGLSSLFLSNATASLWHCINMLCQMPLHSKYSHLFVCLMFIICILLGLDILLEIFYWVHIYVFIWSVSRILFKCLERFPAHAYKVCNNDTGWTEKANYSECLDLIAKLPPSKVIIRY